jgi:hypothetical protein
MPNSIKAFSKAASFKAIIASSSPAIAFSISSAFSKIQSSPIKS